MGCTNTDVEGVTSSTLEVKSFQSVAHSPIHCQAPSWSGFRSRLPEVRGEVASDVGVFCPKGLTLEKQHEN